MNIMLASPDLIPRGTEAHDAEAFFVLRVLIAVLFLFLTFALVSAIGLLKRKNWARRTFIVLFAVGIAFHAVALLLFLVGTAVLSPATPIPESQIPVSSMIRLVAIPMAIGALGISLLLGWLIKRLISADVRREFS